jgi:hypothetical protein
LWSDAWHSAYESLEILLAPEDSAVHVVQKTACDEVIHPSTDLEGRVELHKRFWPQEPGVELSLGERVDRGVLDRHEAAREILVVADETVAQVEDVHLAFVLP